MHKRNSMKHLLDMTADELATHIADMGLPAFRARQIQQWVWTKRVADFGEMTNLPKDLRARLAGEMAILTGRIVRRSDATDGVIKLLLAWPDGERIETVMIPTRPGETGTPRRTACVSTQVGCAVGCTFCASGLDGVSRDLTAGEIVEQVMWWDQLLSAGAAAGRQITHVVLMGMGEPLANYEATVRACRILIDPDRGGLSGRHLTLSTVGLPERIRRLAGEGIPLTLAISLHAPNDALRRQLIPTARTVTIDALIAAAREYFDKTGREVTLEYVLLAGVNDTPHCATDLGAIACRLRCNVNLIRYNEVAGLPYRRPSEPVVRGFRDRLAAAGVNVQIRASRGLEADAACGQLRKRVESP